MADLSSFGFLDLPYVVRSTIYKHLFWDEMVETAEDINGNLCVPLPRIARTCRTLLAEVPPEYCRFCRLHIGNKHYFEELISEPWNKTMFGKFRRLKIPMIMLPHTGFDMKLLEWTSEGRRDALLGQVKSLDIVETVMACGCDWTYLKDDLSNTDDLSDAEVVIKILQNAQAAKLGVTFSYSIQEECYMDSTTLEIDIDPESSIHCELTKWTIEESRFSETFGDFLQAMGIASGSPEIQSRIDSIKTHTTKQSYRTINRPD